MKNLKKVLSLVLVLAMVLALGVSASAATFSDSSDINYTDAVNVLTAGGVIGGYPDGSFKPEGDVTRAEMAKMIYATMTGTTNADAYKAGGMFKDVKATDWFAGYVNFCIAKGIIKGYPDGSFRPDNNITGVEAEVMVLRALGYGQNSEFSGASWKINAMMTAAEVGINANMSVDSYDAPASREEAAAYLFGAIDKPVVVYSKDTNSYNEKVTGTGETAAVVQFGENMKGQNEASHDDFGRPTTDYKDGDGNVIATVTAKATATYTTAVSGGKLYTDLGLTKSNAPDVMIRYTVDGKCLTYTAGDTDTYAVANKAEGIGAKVTDFVIASGNSKTIGGAGTVTEVYYNARAKEVQIVVINTYVAEIQNFVAAKKNANGEVTEKAYITLKDADAAGMKDLKFETEDYTKADKDTVVLYTKAANGNGDDAKYVVTSVEKAETISGKLTKKSTSNGVTTYTIGGTGYVLGANPDAALNDAAVMGADNANMGKDVAFYVDANKNLMKAVAASEVVNNYLYIISASTFVESTDMMTATKTYTGTVYGIKDDGTYGTYDVEGTLEKGQSAPAVDELQDKFASYTDVDNDGELEITVLADDDATAKAYATNAEIKPKATTVPIASSPAPVMNSTTLFVYATQGNKPSLAITALTTATGNANCGYVAEGAQVLAVDGVAKLVISFAPFNDGSKVANYAYIDIPQNSKGNKVYNIESSIEGTTTIYTATYTGVTAEGEEVKLTKSAKTEDGVKLADSGVYAYNTDNTVGDAVEGTVTGEVSEVKGTTVKIGENFYNVAGADITGINAEADSALAVGSTVKQSVVAIKASDSETTLTHVWIKNNASDEAAG